MTGVEIRVRYWGGIAEKLGRRAETFRFPQPVDVRTLLSRIIAEHGPGCEGLFFDSTEKGDGGSRRKPAALMTVNDAVAGAERVLADGDTVGFVQAVAGG